MTVYEEYCHKIKEKEYVAFAPINTDLYLNSYLYTPQGQQRKALEALAILDKAQLLNAGLAEIIYSQPDLEDAYALLCVLRVTGLLEKPVIQKHLAIHLTYASLLRELVRFLNRLKHNNWDNLLTDIHFYLLLEHPELSSLYDLLYWHSPGMPGYTFTEAEFAILMHNPSPKGVGAMINAYYCSEDNTAYEHPLIAFIIKKGLDNYRALNGITSITSDLVARIIHHEHAWSIYQGCQYLTSNHCFTVDAIEQLLAHPNPSDVVMALQQFKKIPLMLSNQSQKLYEALIHAPYPQLAINAVEQLCHIDGSPMLAIYPHLNRILSHPCAELILAIISCLRHTTLLFDEVGSRNVEVLIEHEKIWEVHVVVTALHKCNLLTLDAKQELYDLITSEHPKTATAVVLAHHNRTLLDVNQHGDIVLVNNAAGVPINTHVLWILAGSELLTLENIAAINYYQDCPYQIIELIELMHDLQLLDISFKTFINLHINIPADRMADSLVDLYNLFLLAANVFPLLSSWRQQQFFEELVDLDKTHVILMAFYSWMTDLSVLDNEQMIPHFEEDLFLIAMHSRPVDLAQALATLRQHELLTGYFAQQNRELVASSDEPLAVARALVLLNQHQLLTGTYALEHRWGIACHKKPEEAARALIVLEQIKLLASPNSAHFRDALFRYEAPWYLACALAALQRARLLDDDNVLIRLNLLCGHDNPLLVAETLNEALKSTSPQHNRLLLIQQLNKYIQRVESHKIKSATAIQFDAGFLFFSQSRAQSREANYLLAQQLLDELVFSPQDTISKIFTAHAEQRAELGSKYIKNYKDGAINSMELKQIILLAADFSDVEQAEIEQRTVGANRAI